MKKSIFIQFLNLFLVSNLFSICSYKLAIASCDPCRCGPGGSYEWDIEEWFRKNCTKERPMPFGMNNFIGEYKPVGECLMFKGDQVINEIKIEPLLEFSSLPSGTLLANFTTSNFVNNYYLFTYLIPGNGYIKDPLSIINDPIQIHYNTEIKNGLFIKNSFHQNTKIRNEFLSLLPSNLGGPIWNLQYTDGTYLPMDKCQFVKVK